MKKWLFKNSVSSSYSGYCIYMANTCLKFDGQKRMLKVQNVKTNIDDGNLRELDLDGGGFDVYKKRMSFITFVVIL